MSTDILIVYDSLGCKKPRENNSEISSFINYLQSGLLTRKTELLIIDK